MNKNIKFKIIICILIINIILFCFSNNKVFADIYENSNGEMYEYEIGDPDPNDDGPNVNSLRFQLTYYGAEGEVCLNGSKASDFTTNEKYGWEEIEIDGIKYAVFAGATHYMLETNKDKTYGEKWFYGAKFKHIHYFKTKPGMSPRDCEKIQFKFEDSDFDPNIYNGVILDTGDAMMFPQCNYFIDKGQVYQKDVNALDIYFKNSDEKGTDNTNAEKINNKIILVSMDGAFNKTADTKEKSFGTFLQRVIALLFSIIGDATQKVVLADTLEGNVEDYKLLYTTEQIENDETLSNQIDILIENLTENNENDENNNNSENNQNSENNDNSENNKDSENKLKVIDVVNVVRDKTGNLKQIFSIDTPIPHIPVDMYTILSNKVERLSINFLQNKGSSNTSWGYLRKIAYFYGRGTLYLAAILIITTLIYKSIILVMASINDDAKKAKEAKMVINKIFKVTMLLILTYVLMAAIPIIYEKLTELVSKNVSGYVFRIKVSNIYSFNSNVSGFFKYLTLTSDTGQSCWYSLGYMISSILLALFYLIMLVRTLVVVILIIVAPICIVNVMRETEDKISKIFNLKVWIRFYTIIIMFPLVFYIIFRVVFL